MDIQGGPKKEAVDYFFSQWIYRVTIKTNLCIIIIHSIDIQGGPKREAVDYYCNNFVYRYFQPTFIIIDTHTL